MYKIGNNWSIIHRGTVILIGLSLGLGSLVDLGLGSVLPNRVEFRDRIIGGFRVRVSLILI